MNKEVIDALHMLLHCSLKDTEYETQKEQFEIIKNYINNLQQENQQLKEQLDNYQNKYNNRLNNQLAEGLKPDLEDYYLAEIEGKANMYDNLETQQKEFIKYLEDFINKTDYEVNILGNYLYLAWSNAYKEILSKYKKIVGRENENTKD